MKSDCFTCLLKIRSFFSSLWMLFAAIRTEDDRDELLLSEEFLRNCREMFSIPIRAQTRIREFPIKHINIVDPLKDNNNLGRSVSKGF